ncbi:MAG: hypothetical protein FJY80_09745 [Candidatus Aminicenantes bacterium]|nr:hypothetical protein [Candidatus Aminicenantes bacterium]
MKRLKIATAAAAVFVLAAGAATASAQGVFKIPFKFKAGGLTLPSGEYWAGPKEDGQVVFRHEGTGKETAVAVLQRQAQPTPPRAEPLLVFHVVGNFEPSYTEYVTEYILAELWLPGAEGFVLAVTKGAHQDKTVQGQVAKRSD